MDTATIEKVLEGTLGAACLAYVVLVIVYFLSKLTEERFDPRFREVKIKDDWTYREWERSEPRLFNALKEFYPEYVRELYFEEYGIEMPDYYQLSE